MKRIGLRGVTLLELIVVLLIVSILSSIAVSVYSGYIRRARIATARATIRELELAAARYEVDLGEYPLSSSGTRIASSTPSTPDPSISTRFGGTNGCGYLMTCLLHSYSGNAYVPASARWQGPYLEVDQGDLGTITGAPITYPATALPQICLLDPWGNPYYYVRSKDYASFKATYVYSPPSSGAGTIGLITIPLLSETYYNPSTCQIFSLGPDGLTEQAAVMAVGQPYRPGNGLGPDDINNFR